jgi:hypothetical protein
VKGEKGVKDLEWGVSITDACIGWEETVEMLRMLDDVSEKNTFFCYFIITLSLFDCCCLCVTSPTVAGADAGASLASHRLYPSAEKSSHSVGALA